MIGRNIEFSGVGCFVLKPFFVTTSGICRCSDHHNLVSTVSKPSSNWHFWAWTLQWPFQLHRHRLTNQIGTIWRQWLALCNARILTHQILLVVLNGGKVSRMHIVKQQSTRRKEQQINLLRLPSKRLVLDGSAFPRWRWFSRLKWKGL